MGELVLGHQNEIVIAGLPERGLQEVRGEFEVGNVDLHAFLGGSNTLSHAREMATRPVMKSIIEWGLVVAEVFDELELVKQDFAKLDLPEVEPTHIGIVLPNPKYKAPRFVRGDAKSKIKDNTIFSGRRRFLPVSEEELKKLRTPELRASYPAELEQMSLGFLLRESDTPRRFIRKASDSGEQERQNA